VQTNTVPYGPTTIGAGTNEVVINTLIGKPTINRQ
jgi:hypothetical protein